MKNDRVQWPSLKRNLVAILRGVKPAEIDAIIDILLEEGFEAIEIPLNSPEPFISIEAARKRAPAEILIGAGTVLGTEQVTRLRDCGGNLLVTPNTEPEVISRSREYGMVSMPGAFTATEALAAIKAGASAIKFFPANVLGPKGISGIKAIMPPEIPLGAVGGVTEADFADYRKAGVTCFGLGSSLYKPGDSVQTVKANARAAVEGYDRAFAG
jgi:2-dehydro-3-deoxyphosphogalactonate aldolase